MDDKNTVYDLTSADSKIIGFDFQYFYFISKLLHLQEGEKIGYEVKDDVHIETNNSQILIQLKHTIQKKEDGAPANLTELDEDLWKTISRWSDIISEKNAIDEQMSLIERTQFVLATNKDIDSNTFVIYIDRCNKKKNSDSDIIAFLDGLLCKAKSKKIKGYLSNIKKLSVNVLKAFIKKIEIINTGDSIIDDIKKAIRGMMIRESNINDVFNALLSELKQDFFNSVRNNQHQEITYDEWLEKYSVIFMDNRNTRLPLRKFKPLLPEKPFDLPFIAELIEIGDICDDDIDEVAECFAEKFELEENLKTLHEQGLLVYSEIEAFHQDAKAKWKNSHKSCHRSTISDKEDKQNALHCLDEVRKYELILKDTDLQTRLSNGEFYYLADKQWIGWRKKWRVNYNQ